MITRYFKYIMLMFALSFAPGALLVGQEIQELIIIGGGIAGAMEALFAHLDAKVKNVAIRIKIYDKLTSILESTATRIAPSLTCDELLSVVPRGSELVKKLEILFSNPGGIRVDDVAGINESDVTELFKYAAYLYSLDEIGHNQRTADLLALGKMSMDLWQQLYDNADPELKQILELSNFNPCCQLVGDRALHKGYRIDLIYNVPDAQQRAQAMKESYESLGYTHCAILTPAQVVELDPFLTEFCTQHSTDNVWYTDAVALWRPGGCIDVKVFLPMLYDYLQKKMGTYINAHGQQEDCFQLHLGKKATALTFAHDADGTLTIAGVTFEDGQPISSETSHTQYIFCPGEAVGTLKNLGLCEPAYAGFAGVSLLLTIDIPEDKLQEYATFNHCMEVHQEGVVLAWQARFKDNKIFIGVAGTKAFYSDQPATKDQAFAKNRNLLQLNMINDVLPEFISLALGHDTRGKTLTQQDLDYLEAQQIAVRWAGIRSVVFDGFPSIGFVCTEDGSQVANGRCTTHLGSGGVSFSPAVTAICRQAMNGTTDAFADRILMYGNPSRVAQTVL